MTNNCKKKKTDTSNPEIAARIPELIALRESLYSPAFRDFISKVTGCGVLTDRVDCSANAYPQSGHLLCHDDVIGTRKLSYIIYLTDPDNPWQDEYGGALELYPLEPNCIIRRGSSNGGDQGIPTAIPTNNILPMFNRMAVFIVQPGRSYHAVQEVFNSDSPRLSISGWYHGHSPPVGSDLASLQQIMGKSLEPEQSFKNIEISEGENLSILQSSLSKDDINFLKEYINEDYLSKNVIRKINERFCRDSSVQLSQFLKPSLANSIQEAVTSCDITDGLGNGQPSLNYSAGVEGRWQLVGPPHKQRYMRYGRSGGVEGVKGGGGRGVEGGGGGAVSVKSKHSLKSSRPHKVAGDYLANIHSVLFHSPQFARFINALTSIGVSKVRGDVRRFRAGLDYTVAHYGILTTIPRLDATLCFVDCGDDDGDDDDNDKEALWDDGDVGGFECYIVAEDDANTAEAAEVYKISDSNSNSNSSNEIVGGGNSNTGKKGNGYREEEESLLSVSAKSNVLNLVLRDEKVMKFVKYVSAFAPGSRFDISAEYEIIP